MKKGEVTVYLSLVFILLVSFAGALLESASVQNAKNYRRADVDRAVECLFAEYQRELLEEYDIFALEASYETGRYTEQNIKERLSFYGAGQMEHKIKRIQFLTDNGCRPFYEQISAYMRHKYGLTAMEDKLGAASVWKEQEEKAGVYEQEDKEAQNTLDELLSENDSELPKEENPLEHAKQLKQTPLLSLVSPKDMHISEKSVPPEGLLERRERNKGYGDFSDVGKEEGAVSRLLLGEYLLEHFNCASDKGEKTGALDYELEYILNGQPGDRENLEKTARKLLLLRFVPNYAYIQTDSEKKAEAKAAALALCALIALPAAVEAAAQGILLAWAFGETIIDIRALLKGSKVPLVKSKESWQLQLSSMLTLGTDTDYTEGKDSEDGLDYREYMRILLFLADSKDTGLRTLDMIEQDLRREKGLAFFKADQCVSRMEIETTVPLRRGITYQFPTYYGYR